MSMSTTYPRLDADPTAFAPPPSHPDPFANTPGKLGDILRNGGPLDSGIHQQMAGKHLLENADQYTDSPVEWEERPKGIESDLWNKEYGVAGKPKDPRQKKDKDPSKTESKQAEVSDKPYDRDKYYDKNSGHLDGGRATDWLNQKAYETKANDAGNGSTKSSFTESSIKRTGLSADTHYGNFTPELRDGPLSEVEVHRKGWHKGHEDVSRLNGGNGYSQTNHGVWAVKEEAKKAGTGSFGMGARAEVANVFDLPGSGQATVRANGLAGFESSGGGKFKVKASETNISAGGEARAGVFGEVGGNYRPVTIEPKIFGAPINLSPEVNWAGRVFNGAEAGAGFKSGWRLTPDIATGKMSPEAGIEAKAAAFVGGKAEGEATVGLGGIGNVGGSAAGLYGIGAEGKAKLGLSKDESGKTKLKFELKGALALGLGLGVGIKGEINIDGLLRFGSNVVNANRAFFNKVGQGANTAINTVKQGVSAAVTTTKEVAKKAVETVKAVAPKVVEKAKEVATKVADTVKTVTDKVEEGIKEGAKKVGSFFKGLFK